MQWPHELVDAVAACQLPHIRRNHSKLLAIPGVELLHYSRVKVTRRLQKCIHGTCVMRLLITVA